MKNFIFTQGIALRVLILFSVAIGMTFLGDYLESINWYDDYIGYVHHHEETAKEYGYKQVEEVVRWGVRHLLYFWGSVILFIIQLVSIIIYIVNKVDNEY